MFAVRHPCRVDDNKICTVSIEHTFLRMTDVNSTHHTPAMNVSYVTGIFFLIDSWEQNGIGVARTTSAVSRASRPT